MTPNPWERLREAAEYFVDAALVYASEMTFRDFLAKWPKADSIDIIREAGLAKLRQALAALPATPPEQPASDAERERAIDTLTDTLRYARATQAISETRFQEAWGALDLMRSAPAPQPVPEKPAPLPEHLGMEWIKASRNARCLDHSAPLVRVLDHRATFECGCEHWFGKPKDEQPVPAPPASDWRERFDLNANAGPADRNRGMCMALRDGIAALEAEVARMRKEKP